MDRDAYMPKKPQDKDQPPRSGTYHHGSLREALIEASEDILRERGADGFSLREAARRANVSPAAPAHHFGDARGLLTAIATLGYQGLADTLRRAEADTEGQPYAVRIKAHNWAYINYARDYPARFDLMWMRHRLNREDPDYLRASFSAYASAYEIVTGQLMPPPTGNFALPMTPNIAAYWSLAHGLALLAREGFFGPNTEAIIENALEKLSL